MEDKDSAAKQGTRSPTTKRKRQGNLQPSSSTKAIIDNKNDTIPFSKQRINHFSAGLAVLYPRKSRRTLTLLEKEQPLDYYTSATTSTSSSNAVGSRMIQSMVEDLDRLLFTIANGNGETAKAIIAGLLKKRPFLMMNVTTTGSDSNNNKNSSNPTENGYNNNNNRKRKRQDHTSLTDPIIAQGVVNFLHLHTTGGRRPTHEQDAVDAVLTAACSATASAASSVQHQIEDGQQQQQQQQYQAENNNNAPTNSLNPPPITASSFPLDKIASRLQISQTKLLPYHQQAGQRFVPKVRKIRADCYRAEAIQCVHQFCHSDESSWAIAAVAANGDNNNNSPPPKYAVRKVIHPITNVTEHHIVRVWHAPTPKERYNQFLQSTAYRDFVNNNTTSSTKGGCTNKKTIGRTVFQSSLCACVLNHHPKGKDRDKPTTNNTTHVPHGEPTATATAVGDSEMVLENVEPA